MEKETARLEAFSDGIFGVAITLLAIDIGIKEYDGASNLSLWHDIAERWPEYFAYFNSFALVLLVWMGHHTILKPVRRANVATLFLNGAILLLVALFPFPTRTVGRFIGTQAEATAVAFYAGFTGLIGLSMLLLTLYLRSHQRLLMAGDPGIAVLQRLPRWQLTGVIAYAGLAGLTLLSPRSALVGTFVMWLFWAVVLLRSEAHATLE